ncbi:MAG: hypothetical protein NTZ50_01580 [Chloroflexi bacterium]|nr:hypothetical protein [Chloroflexota bacterium]
MTIKLNILQPLLKRARRLIRRFGWEIIPYHPMWRTLLGIERLPIRTVIDIGAYDGDTG